MKGLLSAFSLLLWGCKFTEPDVAVADWMVVVLQRKREFVRTCGVRRTDVMAGGSGEFDIVLRENTVVEDGNVRGASEFAGCIKARAMPDDVVDLPLAGGTRSIDERRILTVHRGNLAIGISFAVVRIQHLNFVKAHQEDAAVTAVLVFAFGRIGLAKLDMELAIAEVVFSTDVAGLGRNFKVAVFDFPRGGAPILFLDPFGEVFAVEKHDRVRRRFARCILRTGCAGGYDRRAGTITVVNFPFGVDLGVCGKGKERKDEWRSEEFFHAASKIEAQ